ncbi:MAG: hypothetical protein ACO1TE_04565 [Prosthecobacter sp.]
MKSKQRQALLPVMSIGFICILNFRTIVSKNRHPRDDKLKELPSIRRMNLPAFRLGPTISRLALGIPLLFVSCIKQSDYDLLLKQNQELESKVQMANQQVLQEQAATKAVQARMMQLINIQSTLQKRDQELQDAKTELETLKAEFDKFRTQRRGAMVGKKYPHLSLDNGKLLINAEVISVDSNQLSVRHEGGLIKVAMADSNEQLRWEACYDPEEAKRLERARFLADARMIDAQLERDKLKPVVPVPQKASGPSAAEMEARAAITAQRAQLNREYEALRSKNPSAFKNVSWSSNRPEASAMLNSMTGRPAVLGLSRLDSLRDAINVNLLTLQSLGARLP